MMKKKRFLYLLLAIALLVGFFIYRNRAGTPAELAEPLISSAVSVLDGDAPASGTAQAPPQEESSSADPVSSGQEALPDEQESPSSSPSENKDPIDRDGVYDSKEDVALYIHTFGCLPSNYITKDEAKAAGWSGNGSDKLDKYCPGKCIGGDRFGNREGLLPSAKGRTWTECDIGTLGAKNRGVKRIVFSNDGLIYYTGDHYESFELLYGEP